MRHHQSLLRQVTSLLFLFALFISSSVYASVSGIVVDKEKNPIVGATIATDVAAIGTLTGENGTFELKNTDAVTEVTISSVGYKSRQFKLNEMPFEITLESAYYKAGDILVSSSRAKVGETPVAFNNFSAEEIERDYDVGEFPLLLKNTPNLHTFVDAGSSLGFGSIRIRGFDDKRVVTYINGVPLNDPEDQLTYFVDLPDFAANITDIQVQRGVGNSLYGDASFGGTINVVTDAFAASRQTSVSFGYGEYLASGKSIGSFYKQNFEFSSGTVNNKWIYGGRFSKQKSDGYRERSWYRGWSYYFTVGRMDPNMVTELHIYGGPIKYHAAWYGHTREELAENRRINTGIPGYDELTYSNATDNFNQPHYHLHNHYTLNDKVSIHNTLYYIRGKGFYEQYRPFSEYSEYNIDTSLTSASSGDLVRQLWVEKNQYGWNPSVEIEHERGKHTLGASLYYFNAKHYGKVVWAQNLTGPLEPQHVYHTYYGTKYVGSVYAQENYDFNDKLATQATAQIRFQDYTFERDNIGVFTGLDYNVDYLFFSPRIGFTYDYNENFDFYTNFAIASRTPTDKAIFDGDTPDPGELPNLEVVDSMNVGGYTQYEFGDPTVKEETVTDIELGFNYRNRKSAIDFNIYWMNYKNMIVAEGGVTDGIYNSLNVDRVVHSGIEIASTYKFNDEFTLTGNFAYNHNRVKEFEEIFYYSFDTTVGSVDTAFDESTIVDFSGKKVSRFPEILGNFIADYNSEKFRFTYYGNYIGKQYSDLYNIESLAIDPVFVSSIALELKLGKFLGIGNLLFSTRVDNIFSKKYESAVAYAENYAYRNVNESPTVDGWSTFYVASELSFFSQLKMELF